MRGGWDAEVWSMHNQVFNCENALYCFISISFNNEMVTLNKTKTILNWFHSSNLFTPYIMSFNVLVKGLI